MAQAQCGTTYGRIAKWPHVYIINTEPLLNGIKPGELPGKIGSVKPGNREPNPNQEQAHELETGKPGENSRNAGRKPQKSDPDGE